MPLHSLSLPIYLALFGASAGEFQWPLRDVSFPPEQDFDAYKGIELSQYHCGLDLVSVTGNDTIRAAAEGTVYAYRDDPAEQGKNGGWGYSVALHHANGVYTLYGHMKEPPAVTQLNQHFSKGEFLGIMGKTGRAEGKHLHFEVRKTAGFSPGHNTPWTNTYFDDLCEGLDIWDPRTFVSPHGETPLAPTTLRVEKSPTLDIRSGPGMDYAKVSSLRAGQRVVAFAASGGWYKVHLATGHEKANAYGYIQGGSGNSVPDPSSGRVEMQGTGMAGLRIRASPSASSPNVKTLNGSLDMQAREGQAFGIAGTSSLVGQIPWFQIHLSGNALQPVGWVSGEYLLHVPGQSTGGPSVPRNVYASVAGPDVALISWNAPASSPGGPVTGYWVTALPGGKSCFTPDSLRCLIEGLTTAMAYTFTVEAENANGKGPASAPSPPLTLKGKSSALFYYPSPLVFTVGVPIAPVSPHIGNGPVTRYYAEIPKGTGLSFDESTGILSGTPSRALHLENFQVMVLTPERGLDTPTVNITIKAVAPGAPTAVQAAFGNARATLSWLAPASTGGSPITRYLASASPGGATCQTTGLSCSINGLSSGTYTFTVTATNAGGLSGPASDAASLQISSGLNSRTLAPTSRTFLESRGRFVLARPENAATARAVIADAGGRTLWDSRFTEQIWSWDGRDRAGKHVPPGLYFLKLSTWDVRGLPGAPVHIRLLKLP